MLRCARRQVPGDKCQASGARIFLPIGGQLAGCHVLCCVFSLLKSGAFCSIFLDQVAMKRKTSARSLPSSIGSSNFSSDLSCHVLAVKSPENAAEVHLPPSVRSSPPSSLELGHPVEDCREENSIGSDSDLPQDDIVSLTFLTHRCESDEDVMNSFDDANSPDEMWVEDMEKEQLETSEYECPSPSIAKLLIVPQDVAEYYSRPRLLPVAHRLGLRGTLSLDIVCGWDFCRKDLRCLSIELLTTLCICFCMLSPPCTVFSDLQRLYNIKRIRADVWKRRWETGMLHLRHSMECARVQVHRKAFFAFEHPGRATSWREAIVKDVENLSGVYLAEFDMCMLGLVSKVAGKPIRKRTKLMTNSWKLANALRCYRCNGQHDHQVIQGSEGGVWRSAHAQIYPDAFVQIIAEAAAYHAR